MNLEEFRKRGKERYLDRIKNFETLCRYAGQLSKESTDKQTDERGFYGSPLFAKAVMTTWTLNKLLPFSKNFSKCFDQELWDLSSICILTRGLIDNYYLLFYLCIEDIQAEELEFRLMLWQLHSSCERLKMLDKIGSRNPELNNVKKKTEKIRQVLLNNRFFNSLKSREQKKFLKGKEGVALTRSVISKRASINPEYAFSVYKYLSQYVHSYSFAIEDIIKFNTNDLDALLVINTVVEEAIVYLSYAIKGFRTLEISNIGSIPNDVSNIIDIWIDIAENFGNYQKLQNV